MPFASKIFLVRPARFGFNPETAGSNAFQERTDLAPEDVSKRAREEFDGFAEELRSLGIETVIAKDPPEPHTPDAVFPNNWFSTHPDGTLVLYPMEAAARRLERVPSHVEIVREACGTETLIDLTSHEAEGRFLEGTGSLVIDHDTRTAYACISSRTDPDLARKWAEDTGHSLILFHAYGSDGKPVYHTNVLMCVGKGFAVLCGEAITDEEELGAVTNALESSGRELITITQGQMEEFAGNLLQLENASGEPVLVMSSRARAALTDDQLSAIERHTKIADLPIPMIEQCGGGSVRCMIAELFTN
ncbi:MAG TPA: arginine deiminase-related protein [Aridibacter sp.]|nr:arginine deiminase-related protein [Aridibacter sp.]